MSVLTSALSPRAADFVANAQTMQAMVDDLRAQLQASALGGGEAARTKQLAQNLQGLPLPSNQTYLTNPMQVALAKRKKNSAHKHRLTNSRYR